MPAFLSLVSGSPPPLDFLSFFDRVSGVVYPFSGLSFRGLNHTGEIKSVEHFSCTPRTSKPTPLNSNQIPPSLPPETGRLLFIEPFPFEIFLLHLLLFFCGLRQQLGKYNPKTVPRTLGAQFLLVLSFFFPQLFQPALF